MKKLLFLLLFLIPVLSFGQRTWESDSLVVTDLTGTDLVVGMRQNLLIK